jgi:hypothetical protein
MASAGGQELQPCEVKSSTAQGPDLFSARAARAAKRPAPAIKTERLRTPDMAGTWAQALLSSNQQTVRLALRNIITIRRMHGSSSPPGTALLGMSATQRIAWALGVAAVLWLAVWWAL